MSSLTAETSVREAAVFDERRNMLSTTPSVLSPGLQHFHQPHQHQQQQQHQLHTGQHPPQTQRGQPLRSASIVIPVPIPVRKRASKPKVRTGCVTCKSRHVRCDERKPTCFRCEKARVPCAGYAPIPPKPRPARPATPRQRREIGIAPPLQTIRPALVPSCFAVNDIVYFDFFRHSLAADLSGYLQTDFWTRVVLSESTRDECVQHGILALGALSQALFSGDRPPAGLATGSSPTPLHPQITEVLNEHHGAAIHHQNEAISLCLKRIREGQGAMPPRALLIITLLLVAYEFLQGNLQGADGLMETGIGLLRDAIPILRETHTGRKGPRTVIDDEMRDLEHLLPYLSVMSGYTGFCSGQHRLYPRAITAPETQLPVPGVTSPAKMLSAWGGFLTHALIFNLQAAQWQSGRVARDKVRLQMEQGKFLAQLRRWREIMLDYRERLSNDTRMRRAMRLVRLQYLQILITLSCCLDTTDMSWDGFEPEFREMLRLCNEFLGDPEPMSKIRFTFEGGSLAAPLMGIAVKCRRRDLRMKAVAAFRKLSWRECAWDGKALLCGAGLAVLEEGERNDRGQIPPSGRYAWTGVNWDSERRRLVAEYTKSMPDENGARQKRRLALDVDRWSPDAFVELMDDEERDESVTPTPMLPWGAYLAGASGFAFGFPTSL